MSDKDEFVSTGVARVETALANTDGHPMEHLRAAVVAVFEHIVEWAESRRANVQAEQVKADLAMQAAMAEAASQQGPSDDKSADPSG